VGGVFADVLEFIGNELAVIFVAMLPYVELRGAIPMGISMGMHPMHAFFLALIGSTLPSPVILLVFRPFFSFVKRTGLFRSLTEKAVERTMKKADRIKKYYVPGLFIFVAIPLPGTGVWAGSLAAALLNIRLLHALPTIFLGNAVAGLIITLISYGIIGAM
jgi:uncharacterized membrane protein